LASSFRSGLRAGEEGRTDSDSAVCKGKNVVCLAAPASDRGAAQATGLRRGVHPGRGAGTGGLRDGDTPLDLHLWTDVPVRELGPVVPVLRDEIEAGLDGLMLAAA
jgi:hypothetical protein